MFLLFWCCFTRFGCVLGYQMCLDQVKRRPAVYADMLVFHVFAIRALFPCVSMCFGHVLEHQTCLGQIKWRSVVFAQHACFPSCRCLGAVFMRSAMPRGQECVRVKLSDPWAFFSDMPLSKLSLFGRYFHAFWPCSRVTNVFGTS
jgi:hypothetical protein